MFRLFHAILLSAVIVTLPAALLAGTDEYLGDTTIYSGVPTTMSRPNVLIIIDNSKATLNTAPGFEYRPEMSDGSTNVYGQKEGCDGANSPSQECYLPWNIYEIDNQGDVANQVVLTNSSYGMTNLTCANNDDVVRKTLQQRGTYSGSGTANFPNIGSNGACDTSPKGAVYVLGNYLNYTLSTSTTILDENAPTECEAPNPIVSYTYPELYCTNLNQTLAQCPAHKIATRDRIGYFQAKVTHTASAASKPFDGLEWTEFWNMLSPDGTYPSATAWDDENTYIVTSDVEVPVEGVIKTCSEWLGTTTVEQRTQREIMFQALENAVVSARGSVHFAAMVYGDNNSGGQMIHHMADLSLPGDDPDSLEPLPLPADFNCTGAVSDPPLCKFLAALPGSGQSGNSPLGTPNNIGTVSSNTGRPQAESLFDAGYYFGATYASVTNTLRIPDDMKNPCDLNHVILLTNGFTNGDDSPNMDLVGDADGDGYPNEDVYGLGSHWLDDVAKHLHNYYGITTHTVLAFQDRDTLIENAAKDGDGSFFNAYSAEELSAALLKLMATIINEGSTSFVAPVVPASTTNRTVSSNKVYLGLFRPQEDGPWHGNVKKYSIGTTNQLLAADGTAATDPSGNFDEDSISYWSLRADGLVSSAGGDIDPDNEDANKAKGDGGQVDAGGAGGKLLEKVTALAAAVKSQGTWTPTGQSWRNIYTVLFPELPSGVTSTTMTLTAAQNHFVPTNSNITSATLGVASAAERDNLIRFVHGFADDDLGLTSTAAPRKWVMGDVLHSRPLVFNYTKYGDLQENLCTADASGMYNSSIIFVGANDGMLHAIRDCDGSELWSFIPPENLQHLKYFLDPVSVGGHPAFVDGAPSAFVHDVDADGVIESADGDKVVLLFGQRRGGGSSNPADRQQGGYYAIDVTDPAQPVALWRTGYSSGDERDEFAQTWAQPRLAKVKIDENHFKVVMFVGAGYDTNEDTRYGNNQNFPCDSSTPVADRSVVCTDTNYASSGGSVDGSGDPVTSAGSVVPDNRLGARGRGLYAIEVADMTRADATSNFTAAISGGTVGDVYWSYRPTNNGFLDYSFASDLTVIDQDGNSYADLIYVGDTGGNLWRFNLSDPNAANWSGEILFKSNPGSDSTNGRKFFYRPTVATVGAPHIYIGTGDREHPLNRAVTDRMYCIIDWKATYPNDEDIVYPIVESMLEDVTSNALQDPGATQAEVTTLLDRLRSRPDLPYDDEGNFRYGWYIRLDGTDRNLSGDPGEKVLAQATVFNGQVFFSTYQLYTGTRAGCDAGNLGISRLYHLDFKTGEAVYNYNLTNDLTAADEAPANERAVGGENGEMLLRADRVRTLGEGIPSGIVTLIDASGKVTILISSSDKVEASGLPDVKLITPVYWMQW